MRRHLIAALIVTLSLISMFIDHPPTQPLMKAIAGEAQR
jgi:hypothetical protein